MTSTITVYWIIFLRKITWKHLFLGTIYYSNACVCSCTCYKLSSKICGVAKMRGSLGSEDMLAGFHNYKGLFEGKDVHLKLHLSA